MSEPEFSDILSERIETSDDESSALICKLGEARVSAAYWQGRCEGLELAIAHMKAGHEEVVQQLTEGHETTLAYLKDRLNRLETSRGKDVT